MNLVSGGNSHPKVVGLLRGRGRAAETTVQLVEELKQLVMEQLRERLNVMFDGADDLLFDFAERASNNNDRRLFFDTMRAVRLGRKNMTTKFEEAIAASFTRAGQTTGSKSIDSLDDGELTLQKTDSLELDIAVSNMATKADGLYKQTLWEIGGRMQSLVNDSHAPISVDAVAPTTICKAFRSSAESLKVEFAVELVIFKLFDRLVISDLSDLYTRILQFLKQHGVRSQNSGFAPSAHASRPPPSRGESSRPAGPPPAYEQESYQQPYAPSPHTVGSDLYQAMGLGNDAPIEIPRAPLGLAAAMMMSPSLDAQTLNSLQRISAESPSMAMGGYSNARLAADLAAAAMGQPIVGWGPRQTTAYVQRASLVGHMFNDILADPQMPENFRAQFDVLRMPTIKVALRENSFIADPDHPVRGLINELATMATTSRAGGDDTQQRIEELVGQIQKQFDIAAESLRSPTSEIELIETEQAERFIEQQLAQSAARRQAMVKKVRRIIAEELQLRTRGHTITDDIRPLLHSAWAPMMAMHLLHHGPDSQQWQQGMGLLDRILQALSPRKASDALSGSERQTLFGEMEKEFRAVGLGESRVRSVLAGFDRALQTSAPPPAPEIAEAVSSVVTLAPAAAPEAQSTESSDGATELLEQLILPGAWFLIYDHDRSESRWMKAVSFYAGLDCAAFAEFNGRNTLLQKSRMLLDDIAAHRTVPIDLGPAAKSALDRFLAHANGAAHAA